MRASSRPGTYSRASQEGYLLMFLTPLLLLLGAFFLGSLKVAAGTQERAALQARLDVCAVKLALGRERLFTRLATLNFLLEANVAAIEAARAAALIPGVGEAAMATEEALLSTNSALANGEEAAVLAAGVAETAALRCAESPYSSTGAVCLATPVLAEAFERQETLFPDVLGELALRRGEGFLTEVRCAGGRLQTKLAVEGDARLRKKNFHDAYLL